MIQDVEIHIQIGDVILASPQRDGGLLEKELGSKLKATLSRKNTVHKIAEKYIMNTIPLTPIAIVKNPRTEIEDDNWGDVISIIELDASMPEEALLEIESFSHAEIIYSFHLVPDSKIESGSRHPRNNTDWPKVGILSQRGKNRPNRLRATIVKVLRREGPQLHVQGLDAIDGTPILDIKPVMREFLPREEVHQPEWATELMKNYWQQEKA